MLKNFIGFLFPLIVLIMYVLFAQTKGFEN